MEYIEKLCEFSMLYVSGGELFVSHDTKSKIVLQNGEINEIDMQESEGLSLRSIDKNGNTYFASSSDTSVQHLTSYIIPKMELFVNKKALRKPVPKAIHERSLYPQMLFEPTITQRIEVLREMDSYIKNNCSIIKTLTIKEICSHSNVYIYNSNGLICDKRPLFTLILSGVIEKNNGELDHVHVSLSQRHLYSELIFQWKQLCNEMIRKSKVIAEAKPFVGGNLPVILGPGVPATLLHEAVGHGLEADFNYKKTSVFSDKMHKKIASDLVTVVDDGTLSCSRGTLNFDDEGTPTSRTTLIEKGVLVNYMFDKLSAMRFPGKKLTGNGRRESYAHQPMPRMTNTIMLAGNTKLKDMIESIDNGIMAMDFGTGQVDVTSGQFSFNGSEAYKITNGKIDYPISKCSISGMGLDVMNNIIGVGDNFKMDPNGGTCGKNGQNVPVNLGQPSILVSNMIVG